MPSDNAPAAAWALTRKALNEAVARPLAFGGCLPTHPRARRFVTQQMGKALSSEALQGGLDGHRRIESDRSRMHCLRQASGSEEAIASLGLATGFDVDGRSVWQTTCP